MWGYLPAALRNNFIEPGTFLRGLSKMSSSHRKLACVSRPGKGRSSKKKKRRKKNGRFSKETTCPKRGALENTASKEGKNTPTTEGLSHVLPSAQGTVSSQGKRYPARGETWILRRGIRRFSGGGAALRLLLVQEVKRGVQVRETGVQLGQKEQGHANRE